MDKEKVKFTTLVLAGSLLTTFSNIGSGWAASLISLAGFVIFLIGLNSMKEIMDEQGKSAVSLIFIGVIIGAVGALIGLIPLLGAVIAGLCFIAAFIIQLIGYIRLKSSTVIGEIGAKGANLLVISMIVVLVGSVFSIIPAVGGFIAPLFYLAALLLIFNGWFKIQQGLIGETSGKVVAVSMVLSGMLIQLSNNAASGWGAAVASIIGLILLFMGLNRLKTMLDEPGQSAVKLIIIAIFIGVAASLLDFVSSIVNASSGLQGFAMGDLSGFMSGPTTFDMIVAIVFIVAFAVELMGLMKLKASSMLDASGKSGTTLLVVAMILAALASLFTGILPFGAGVLNSLLGLAGMFLVLYGWLRIQMSFAE